MKMANHFITKNLLLLILATCCFLSSRSQNNAPLQRTISATGNSKIEIVPDEIYIAVNLREYDKKGAGKIDIETIKNNFLIGLQKHGFERYRC